MPAGWWVLGRSPARILTGDPDRPFLFDVGDRVRFTRIDRAGFDPTPERIYFVRLQLEVRIGGRHSWSDQLPPSTPFMNSRRIRAMFSMEISFGQAP